MLRKLVRNAGKITAESRLEFNWVWEFKDGVTLENVLEKPFKQLFQFNRTLESILAFLFCRI